MKKLIWIMAIFFCSFMATSCLHLRKPKFMFVLPQFDTTIRAIKIPISELALNYKKYQGKYVETTGKFYEAFEEFAIYSETNIEGEASAFWLGINDQLNIDNRSFDQMSGRRVTIKGMVDTTGKGHLNSYPATISKIYSWVQE